MKKIFLFIAIVASPVFAQEEEQEVQIEIETGGGVEVGVRGVIAYPDKSAWVIFTSYVQSELQRSDLFFYCWVDENEEPRCKEVEIDD